MSDRNGHAPILMAEDDDDDFYLTRAAFEKASVANPLVRVRDGVELLEYLRGRGEWSEPGSAPEPVLVLLDLNMPRKDGREALCEIRNDPDLGPIPVVVLTTSQAEEDVLRSYELGVNTFIRKPVTFRGLVRAVKVMGEYWLEIAELPRGQVVRREER